ncbi:MAG: heavy metal-binding domain-containing protein [Bacteroidetes bacterium]|nr:heavy metal-binding domain-containing protein [Bacteroidota bacterium]
MISVTKPGGTVGIFLWDYSEGMELLRYFWDFAVEFDGKAKKFDEGLRFPTCQIRKLEAKLRETVLRELRIEALNLGANVVIGVDLDYSEFSRQGKSMLCLVASGTAVIIKKKN